MINTILSHSTDWYYPFSEIRYVLIGCDDGRLLISTWAEPIADFHCLLVDCCSLLKTHFRASLNLCCYSSLILWKQHFFLSRRMMVFVLLFFYFIYCGLLVFHFLINSVNYLFLFSLFCFVFFFSFSFSCFFFFFQI